MQSVGSMVDGPWSMAFFVVCVQKRGDGPMSTVDSLVVCAIVIADHILRASTLQIPNSIV